jgi:hypothetical protein
MTTDDNDHPIIDLRAKPGDVRIACPNHHVAFTVTEQGAAHMAEDSRCGTCGEVLTRTVITEEP